MPVILARCLEGLAAATLVAVLAWRAGSLSASGALAAAAVGTAAVTAGWNWGALLVIYFVTASALSRHGATEKNRRTRGIVEKGGARDATQVLANGGVFAACAALTVTSAPHFTALLIVAALGALGAAAADTWATEIGTFAGGTPRSILTWRPLVPGTSGGVSVVGTLAMAAGALSMAMLAAALQLGRTLPRSMVIITAAGLAGATADSLLGATLQERRWCAACGCHTEQPVHTCGESSARAGGLAWLDNDAVNLLATIVGASVAVLLASL